MYKSAYKKTTDKNTTKTKNFSPKIFEQDGIKYIQVFQGFPKIDGVKPSYNKDKIGFIPLNETTAYCVAVMLSDESNDNINTIVNSFDIAPNEDKLNEVKQFFEDNKENPEAFYTKEETNNISIEDSMGFEGEDLSEEEKIMYDIEENGEDVHVADEDHPIEDVVQDEELITKTRQAVESRKKNGIHPQVALVATNSGALIVSLLIPGAGFLVMGSTLLANLKILPKFPSVKIESRRRTYTRTELKPKQQPEPEPKPEPNPNPDIKQKYTKKIETKTEEIKDFNINFIKNDAGKIAIKIPEGLPKTEYTQSITAGDGSKLVKVTGKNIGIIAKFFAEKLGADKEQITQNLEEKFNIKRKDVGDDIEITGVYTIEDGAVDINDVITLTNEEKTVEEQTEYDISAQEIEKETPEQQQNEPEHQEKPKQQVVQKSVNNLTPEQQEVAKQGFVGPLGSVETNEQDANEIHSPEAQKGLENTKKSKQYIGK